jgi:hypothetical protein
VYESKPNRRVSTDIKIKNKIKWAKSPIAGIVEVEKTY